jgi:hypothetical protein
MPGITPGRQRPRHLTRLFLRLNFAKEAVIMPSRPYPVILYNPASGTWESRNISASLLDQLDHAEGQRVVEVALKVVGTHTELQAYAYCVLPSGMNPPFGEVSTPTEKFVHSDEFDPAAPDSYERTNWAMPDTTMTLPLEAAMARSPRHVAKGYAGGAYRVYVGQCDGDRYYLAIQFHAVDAFVYLLPKAQLVDILRLVQQLSPAVLGWVPTEVIHG